MRAQIGNLFGKKIKHRESFLPIAVGEIEARQFEAGAVAFGFGNIDDRLLQSLPRVGIGFAQLAAPSREIEHGFAHRRRFGARGRLHRRAGINGMRQKQPAFGRYFDTVGNGADDEFIGQRLDHKPLRGGQNNHVRHAPCRR